MSDLSEQIVFLRSEVRGTKKLDAKKVNPFLRTYRSKLEAFKIEERRDDGKLLKIWTDNVDEFTSELLNDGKTLLFSHKLKLNIFDPHPHSHNNYAHSIQVKLSEGLQKIQVEGGSLYNKIVIVATGFKFQGDGGYDGRWAPEKIYGIGK